MSEKKCRQCSTSISGRTDKKFCSDQCRSTFYNHLHSDSSRYMRNINNTLRKNRRILDELNPGGKIKIPARWLRERGFDFRYHTTIVKARDGSICYYCYEQGYLPVTKNYVLLTLHQDFQP